MTTPNNPAVQELSRYADRKQKVAQLVAIVRESKPDVTVSRKGGGSQAGSEFVRFEITIGIDQEFIRARMEYDDEMMIDALEVIAETELRVSESVKPDEIISMGLDATDRYVFEGYKEIVRHISPLARMARRF